MNKNNYIIEREKKLDALVLDVPIIELADLLADALESRNYWRKRALEIKGGLTTLMN